MDASRSAAPADGYRLEVRRLIARPADVVFQAWTTPSIMEKFMSEPGTRVTALDLRVGGKYHIDMMYQGKSYAHDGEYLVIDRPRQLKFTWISAAAPGRTVVTVNFVAKGQSTEVVLIHEGIATEPGMKDYEGGWAEILGWLAERI